MSKGTPEQYLEMFLSEQIMPKEWYEILKETVIEEVKIEEQLIEEIKVLQKHIHNSG